MSHSASPEGPGIVATDRQSMPPGGRVKRPPAAAAIVARRVAESLTLAAASEIAMGGPDAYEDAGWLRHAYWERVGIYRMPTEHEGLEWPGLVLRATLREEGELVEEAYFAVFADEEGDLGRAPLRGLPDVGRRMGPGLAEHQVSKIEPARPLTPPPHPVRPETPPAPATARGGGPGGSRRRRSGSQRPGPRARR